MKWTHACLIVLSQTLKITKADFIQDQIRYEKYQNQQTETSVMLHNIQMDNQYQHKAVIGIALAPSPGPTVNTPECFFGIGCPKPTPGPTLPPPPTPGKFFQTSMCQPGTRIFYLNEADNNHPLRSALRGKNTKTQYIKYSLDRAMRVCKDYDKCYTEFEDSNVENINFNPSLPRTQYPRFRPQYSMVTSDGVLPQRTTCNPNSQKPIGKIAIGVYTNIKYSDDNPLLDLSYIVDDYTRLTNFDVFTDLSVARFEQNLATSFFSNKKSFANHLELCLGYAYEPSTTHTRKGFTDNGCCEPCPVGQYQEFEQQDLLNDGKFDSSACGYTDEDLDTLVKPKFHKKIHLYVKGGSSDCKVCPKGKFQANTGQIMCVTCPEGQYQDETQKSTCKPCDKGHYSNHYELESGQSGIEKCTLCPGSKVISADQKNCTDCETGHYIKNEKCTECPIGKYSDEQNQDRCKLCRGATTGGSFLCKSDCKHGDLSPAGCCKTNMCNLGDDTTFKHYIPRFDTNDACGCKLCQEGQGVYTDTLQYREETLRCAECAPGQFRAENDQIQAEGLNGLCKTCPFGQHGGGGNIKCDDCPTGTRPNDVELSLSTPLIDLKLSLRSLYKTIGLVATHKFFQKTDVELMSTIAECPPSISHSSDQVDPYGDSSLRNQLCCATEWTTANRCGTATIDTIQSDEDARRLVVLTANNEGECLQGYTKNYLPSGALGTDCCPGQWDNEDKCHGLSSDQLLQQKNAQFSIIRKPTLLQDVVTNAYWECRNQDPPHNNNCKLLGQIGQIHVNGAQGNVRYERISISKNAICTYCPTGKVASDTEADKCMTPKCDVGLQPNDIYDALNGPFNECIPCPVNTFNGNLGSQVNCKICNASAGKQTWGLTGQGLCTTNCTPGRWGAGLNGTQDCMACPRGKYSDANSNNDCAEITNCKIGEFLPIVPPAISDSTVPCPAGKFKNTNTCTDPCVPCPKGQFQDETKQSTCKNCLEGRYQGFEGRSACKTIVCPTGTYKNSSTMIGATHLTESDCQVCPSGKYTRAANLNSCTTPDNTASCRNASGPPPFCDLDEVRAKIYSCYPETNWGPSAKFGTLVVCPCYGKNGFGEKAFDDKLFLDETAKAFSLEPRHIETALDQFYKFETIYRGNPNSTSHRAQWKHTFGKDSNGDPITGSFNFKPMLSHIRELDRSNIHGIRVNSFDNVDSFMEADENVCWAMFIEFIKLKRTGVITATAKKDTFDKYNAFSENTCEPCCCDRKVLVFDGNTHDEIAAKATTDVTIKTTNINVANIRCKTGKGFGACYNHCSEYISIEYPFCGYVKGDNNKLCTQTDNDACIVFRNVRDVEDQETVTLSHRWSIDDFTCVLHTPNNRVLIREKCFVSPQCFAYATNEDMVCMIDQFRTQGTTTKRFTHVYEKTTYDEHNQRLRLEHLLSSQSTDNRNSAADCRTHCFASDNCYAWQHSSIDGLCTVLKPNATLELDFDASKTDLNTQCAESLVSGDITCEKLNNRVFHKEVNRFWLETCCNNNQSTPFAPHGCTSTSTCDEQPQGLTKYCGVDEKKFKQGTNQFYVEEGNTELKLVGVNQYEYRIGNFRDGFSDFKAGCSNCLCNWDNFEGTAVRLTTNSFCQRRAVETSDSADTPVPDVSCGTISAMQAKTHFMKSPSCEICPITHECSTPQTCAKRDVLLAL